MCLHGSNTGLKTYERQGQPELNALCDKVECVIYPTENFAKFTSTIEVDYVDGSYKSRHMDYPLGEPEHPFKRDQVDLKIFSLVEPVSGKERATKIRNMIDGIAQVSVRSPLELVQD